jgi:hypothetical protein
VTFCKCDLELSLKSRSHRPLSPQTAQKRANIRHKIKRWPSKQQAAPLTRLSPSTALAIDKKYLAEEITIAVALVACTTRRCTSFCGIGSSYKCNFDVNGLKSAKTSMPQGDPQRKSSTRNRFHCCIGYMHHKTTLPSSGWISSFIFVVNGLTHGAKTTRKERTMIILEQAMEIIDADWRNIILI